MSTGTPSESQEEGSPIAAIVVGLLIVAVFGFLIFGGESGDDPAASPEGVSKGAEAGAQAGAVATPKGGAVRGGIAPRAVDEAAGRPEVRRNPKLGLAMEGMKLDPRPPTPKVIPEFDDPIEELAYYQAELERERKVLDMRRRFVERAEKMERDAVSARDREAVESRTAVVRENFARQKAVVEALEAKVADLGG